MIAAEERLNNDLESYFAKADDAAENGAATNDAAAKVEEEKKE